MSRPLRRIQEEGSWFARAKEVRLLWVQADGSSRNLALPFIEKLEYHADNKSPFIVLDTQWGGRDHGAFARATRFNELFSEKHQGLSKAGIEVAEFRPSDPADGRLEAFAADLKRACAALRAPLSGLVVVLAPTRVEEPEAFVADVHALITAPSLEPVRWIVVETDSQHLGALVAELGAGSATVVDARLDEAEQQRDLAALAGATPAPNEPVTLPYPWGAWSSGGAMPAVLPPRRLDDKPAPTDEQLEKSGLSPLFVKGGAQLLKRLILGAGLALRQQKYAEAIDLQGRAAELFGGMKMHDEQVTALLVLGSYQLAASARDPARQSYERAAALAKNEKLPTPQAQAELGLGMLDALEQRPTAIGHYATAGALSEAGHSVPLAIECWRMAGQCAQDGGLPEQAVEHWQHALSLAEGLPPEAARVTSAADIARLLANAVALRGERDRSAELHRQAFRIEHGVEPGPIEPDAPGAG